MAITNLYNCSLMSKLLSSLSTPRPQGLETCKTTHYIYFEVLFFYISLLSYLSVVEQTDVLSSMFSVSICLSVCLPIILLLLSGLLALWSWAFLIKQNQETDTYKLMEDQTLHSTTLILVSPMNVMFLWLTLEGKTCGRSCKGMQTCNDKTGIRKMLQIFKGDLARWI